MRKQCTLKDAVSPWLHSFSSIKKYLNEGTKIKINKGLNLISPGERSNFLYYVLKGTLKTSLVHYNGQEKLLSISGPNGLISEGIHPNNNISPVLVTAIENSELVKFSNQQVLLIINKDPDVALDLFNFLSIKYKMLVFLHQSLLFSSPHQRLCRLLCMLSDNFGEIVEEKQIINLRLTQNRLAELLGVSRVTVANILKEMRQKDILEIRNKKIIFNEKICDYCQKQ